METQVAEAKSTIDEQIAGQFAVQSKAERTHVIAGRAKKTKIASAVELETRVCDERMLKYCAGAGKLLLSQVSRGIHPGVYSGAGAT